MAELTTGRLTSVYEEDISTAATGTEIIGGPATVWDVTVVIESSGAVVNFSNSATSYNNTNRCGKVVLASAGTQHLVFPKGLPVTNGLCAVSNAASVDIRVTYE